MGTGDEFPSEKPKRSKVVEKLIEDGEFGLNGAGLVAIAAGGFFSLMVDEIGQVRRIVIEHAQLRSRTSCSHLVPHSFARSHLGGVVASVRTWWLWEGTQGVFNDNS